MIAAARSSRNDRMPNVHARQLTRRLQRDTVLSPLYPAVTAHVDVPDMAFQPRASRPLMLILLRIADEVVMAADIGGSRKSATARSALVQ